MFIERLTHFEVVSSFIGTEFIFHFYDAFLLEFHLTTGALGLAWMCAHRCHPIENLANQNTGTRLYTRRYYNQPSCALTLTVLAIVVITALAQQSLLPSSEFSESGLVTIKYTSAPISTINIHLAVSRKHFVLTMICRKSSMANEPSISSVILEVQDSSKLS